MVMFLHTRNVLIFVLKKILLEHWNTFKKIDDSRQFSTTSLLWLIFKYLNTLSAVTAEGKSEVGRQIEADVLVLVK
jgi:hypothetical protein